MIRTLVQTRTVSLTDEGLAQWTQFLTQFTFDALPAGYSMEYIHEVMTVSMLGQVGEQYRQLRDLRIQPSSLQALASNWDHVKDFIWTPDREWFEFSEEDITR